MAWQHMSVRLTEAAAAAWDRACSRHHVTLTALIEALGESEPADWLPDQVVDRARQLDRERRSRR